MHKSMQPGGCLGMYLLKADLVSKLQLLAVHYGTSKATHKLLEVLGRIRRTHTATCKPASSVSDKA